MRPMSTSAERISKSPGPQTAGNIFLSFQDCRPTTALARIAAPGCDGFWEAMKPTPKPTFALSGAYRRHGVEARLAAGIRCRCGSELRAYDFEVDALGVHAICHGCDQDTVTIERER
jgi:hypothetical protein